MRTLISMYVLASLIAVPVALASRPEAAPPESGALISSPAFGDPLDSHEAKTRLQEATLVAKRAATRRAEPAAAPAAATTVPAQLQSIAACESGGNPSAIGGGGAYRGKYQFSPSTWAAVGGSGDPAAAPEAEQDRRAAMLYARSGPSQWPVCGS